jgi:hypothetical protein
MENEEVAQMMEEAAREIRRLTKRPPKSKRSVTKLATLLANIDMEIDNVTTHQMILDDPIKRSFRMMCDTDWDALLHVFL